MKILFCGYHNPHFLTITEYMEKAIVSLGHELCVYDDSQFLLPGRLRGSVNILHCFDLERLNRRLVSAAHKFGPDVCIMSGGERILPDTIEAIKRYGATVILWTTDAPRDFKSISETAPHYDFVFSSGTEAVELLQKRGIKNLSLLPYACDPNHHHAVKLTDDEYKEYGNDITFVGSFYRNRGEILTAIADLDIGIWGPGWDALPEGSPLKKRVRRSAGIRTEEWAKIFSASKIAVVSHYQDNKTPCYQASPKVFEALACKCFVLVDDQRDVSALFVPGKHLDVFKDAHGLREKLAYYLANPTERARISENGYKEAIEKHTYRLRIKKMLAILASRGKL